jgi:site-specific DNA recombinase
MRAAIYCRVSTDQQEREGTSLQTQLENCLTYCWDKGYDVAYRFSETYSGLSLERPELDKLRELVRSEAIDVLVCHSLDRLTRDPGHGVIITQELEKHHIKLESPTEDIDNSELGKLINYIKGFAAKLEAEKIKERTGRGIKARINKGLLPSGQRGRLYGYLYHDGKREVREPEASTVRDIFSWLLNGDTLNSITYRLRTLNIATPSGKGFWGRSTVHNIVRTLDYTGRTIINFHSEAVELKGVTPAIISNEVFTRVQSILTRNKVLSRRNCKVQYLLRSYMECAHCGRKYRGYASGRTGERSYYCMGRRRIVTPIKCTNLGYKADDLENKVWQEIENALANPRTLSIGLDAQKDQAGMVSQLSKELQTVKIQIVKFENKDERVREYYYLTGDKQKTKEDHDLLSRELETLRKRQQALEDEIKAAKESKINVQGIEQACETLRENSKGLSFEDKRVILEELKVRVIIDGEKVSLKGVIPVQGIVSCPA